MCTTLPLAVKQMDQPMAKPKVCYCLLLIFTHADEICCSVLQTFHNLYTFLIKFLSFTDIDVRSSHEQLLQTVPHHSIQPQMQVQSHIAPPAPPPKDLSTGTKPIPNPSLGKNPINLSLFSASSKDMTEAEWKESKCMSYIIFLWQSKIFTSIH